MPATFVLVVETYNCYVSHVEKYEYQGNVNWTNITASTGLDEKKINVKMKEYGG